MHDNSAQIADLESEIAALRSENADLKSQNADLQRQVSDLQRQLSSAQSMGSARSSPAAKPAPPKVAAKKAAPPPPPPAAYNEPAYGDQGGEPYVALYTFKGEQDGDLAFSKGDTIYVTSTQEGGWWEGTCNGLTGIFPSNYVKRQ